MVLHLCLKPACCFTLVVEDSICLNGSFENDVVIHCSLHYNTISPLFEKYQSITEFKSLSDMENDVPALLQSGGQTCGIQGLWFVLVLVCSTMRQHSNTGYAVPETCWKV